MKRISGVILSVLIIISLLCLPASALVEQGDNIYVTDAAGVLNSETETTITNINGDLEYYCSGAQLAVVFVNYLDGMYSDEYANQLFNDWGVGSSTENNGMLLLAAVQEGKGWLAVGSGISGSFTDDDAGDYLDEYFWDDFDAGNYDTATTQLANALYNWYLDYYNVNITSDNTENAYGGALPDDVDMGGDYAYDGGHSGGVSGAIGGLVMVIVVILLIILLAVIIGSANRGARRGGGWFYPMFHHHHHHRPAPPPHMHNPPHGGGPRPGGGARPGGAPRSGASRPSGGFGGGRSGGGSGRGGGFGGGGGRSGGGSFGGGHSGGGGGGRR